MRLMARRQSVIGELLAGRLSGRKDLTYVSSKGLRKGEAQVWYRVNFGYTVGHDSHVGGGESDIQVDNRGSRDSCLAWGYQVARVSDGHKMGRDMAERE